MTDTAEDLITTPHSLYVWARSKPSKIHYEYFAQSDYEKFKEEKVDGKFGGIRVVQGTQTLHSFVPVDEKNIIGKTFSTNTVSKTFRLKK